MFREFRVGKERVRKLFRIRKVRDLQRNEGRLVNRVGRLGMVDVLCGEVCEQCRRRFSLCGLSGKGFDSSELHVGEHCRNLW